MKILLKALAVLCVVPTLWAGSAVDQTPAESARFRRTGSLEECRKWLAAAQQANSQRIGLASLGRTPGGREIPLVVLDRDGHFEPAAIRRANRMIIWVQGTTDGAAPEGKDAILAAIRDVAVTHSRSELILGASIVFVPIVNVDGHEASAGRVPLGQNGPENAGRRRTDDGIDLSRDYLRLDASESRLLVEAWRRFRPEVFIDLGSEAGFDHRYDLTLETQVEDAGLPSLDRWLKVHVPQIAVRFENGGMRLHSRFRLDDESQPTNGGELTIAPPDSFVGYHLLGGRVAFGLYAQRLQAYDLRVEALRQGLLATISVAGSNAITVRQVETVADRVRTELSQAPGSRVTVALEYRTGGTPVTERLQLWQTKNVYSATTEARFLLASRETTDASVPMRSRAEVVRSISRPIAYLLPPSLERLARHFELHGLPVRKLEKEFSSDLDSFWIDELRAGSTTLNGRPRLAATVRSGRIRRTFPAGSFEISTLHPAGDVAILLLEPESPVSFLAAGEMAARFEADERPRAATIEAKASAWLDQDPALRKRFEEKRKTDPAFGSSQKAMHDWLMMEGPESDPARGLYPIARVVPGEAPR